MKTLEVVPLKDKALNVTLVEKEYDEPFGLAEPGESTFQKNLSLILKPSIAFCASLEKLIQYSPPHYVTEEQGKRSSKEMFEENSIAILCKKHGIPFVAADIDENAKGYLASTVDDKKAMRDRIIEALQELSNETSPLESRDAQRDYLVAYGQCLQDEIAEAEHEIGFPVRENWMVMGILDQARKLEEKEVSCIHVSSPQHIPGVKKLLESMDINVSVLQFSKKLVSTSVKTSVQELSSLLESVQIQVKPVIRRTSEELPYLLFFLDTDNRASPFDISMAYDAGFSAVIPYENVNTADVRGIVQDAIFSRDPKGIRRTCFFVGGKDMEKAEEVLKIVCETMFAPFKTSAVIDPAGAYTTAAAMIAKVEEGLSRSNLGDLRDKTCAIFGTGAVGRTAAILLTRLGCKTMILSLNPGRANGQEYIDSLARLLREKYGANVEGVYAPTASDKVKIMERADVVFCTAAAGVQVIDKEMLKQLRHIKVMADINAVKPLGVEGMKLDDEMREIASGIFGVGALTIGRLKYRLEQDTLREARRTGEGVYNHNFALQLARKILHGESVNSKLALTLTYPVKEKKGGSVS